ncbi:MAG: magnesium protoporphyrin IX methyltransferase [Aestuariivita sp.]|nr:magnesium protoporphyrin IX methyltransferase [Aestuariivita sp.]|tara:strand:+ start:298 stop:969 length:672 start_codon:yes stop_codon:yes gene_type:complete
MSYDQTLNRVESYFDRTATKTWEQLTSDVPVSSIRQTVRKGRDEMRAKMLARVPEDLLGARVLDAGCGPGMMTKELAERGANIVAIDISPSLIDIARKRLSPHLARRVDFRSGDMLDPTLGQFDFVFAMDSLIYYDTNQICSAVISLGQKPTKKVIFTVAPRTKFLMAMWYAGKLFPRSDRSPVMIPQSPKNLIEVTQGSGKMHNLGRVTSGFYISQVLEFSV